MDGGREGSLPDQSHDFVHELTNKFPSLSDCSGFWYLAYWGGGGD